MKVDDSGDSETVSGAGRLIWRSEIFPRVLQTLFRHYVQDADSKVQDSQTEPIQIQQCPQEITALPGGNVMNDVLRCSRTPIMPRLEKNDAANTSSAMMQSITLILQRITSMDSVVRKLKQSIIFNMEQKIEEGKDHR